VSEGRKRGKEEDLKGTGGIGPPFANSWICPCFVLIKIKQTV